MGTVCLSAVRPGRHRAGGKALVLQRGRLEFQLCSPPPGGPWACPWPCGLSSQGRAARRTLGLSLALWSQLAGSRRLEDPGPVLGLVVSARRVAPRSLLCEGGAGSPAGVAMALVLVTTLPEAESSVPKCRVPAISGMTFSFFSSSLFSFFTPMKKSGAGCPLVPLVGRPTFGRSASTQSRLRGSHKLTGLRSCGNSTKAWEQEGPGSPM